MGIACRYKYINLMHTFLSEPFYTYAHAHKHSAPACPTFSPPCCLFISLLQGPDLVPTSSSAAVAALGPDKPDKPDKLDEHDNSSQRNNPDTTAETKSDSNKSDVANATTCPDILDAHLPPLRRIYPLSSLRNLMFERLKKQWR